MTGEKILLAAENQNHHPLLSISSTNTYVHSMLIHMYIRWLIFEERKVSITKSLWLVQSSPPGGIAAQTLCTQTYYNSQFH